MLSSTSSALSMFWTFMISSRAYYCRIPGIYSYSTSPLLLPLDLAYRTRLRIISNHFFLTDFTDICNEGRPEPSVLPCTPRYQLLISFSSPFWHRLGTHPELHSYRPSSAGTGFGCLSFLTVKTGFVLPVGHFWFQLTSGPLTKVAWSMKLVLVAFLLKGKYLVFARLRKNVFIY